MAFDNKPGSKVSPSLRNIYHELENEYEVELPVSKPIGLTSWAKQGVLLINTSLSVVKGNPGTHAKYWTFFTQAVLEALTAQNGIVYMLWGKHAEAFLQFIDTEHNHVLIASHPASAVYGHAGWFGCNHFKQANEIMKATNNFQIEWTKL